MSQQYQKSSTSQIISTSNFQSLDDLPDSELVAQVTKLKNKIRVLSLENDFIERTIMRLDPSLMSGVQQAYEYATKIKSNVSIHMGSFLRSQTSKFGIIDYSQTPSKQLTSPSRVSARRIESSARLGGGTILGGSGPRVNVLERQELISQEMDIVLKSVEKQRVKAAKDRALLRAKIEEVNMRVDDVQKASKDFKQEVIVNGWDRIAQRIPAEAWIKYMNEWFKVADAQIGKLRLRTSTLNSQYAKYKGQIRAKSELNDSLRPVDFEKLKIENDVCAEIIEKKIEHLWDLKKMTGEANLNLTIHKKAMIAQNLYLASILNSIEAKKKQTIHVRKEKVVIQALAENLEQKLEEFKKVRESYEVPDIMDYVNVKAELEELRNSVKALETKHKFQEIRLMTLTKSLVRKSRSTKYHKPSVAF